ncbi:MAG: hypothetical protein CENE_00390 [Candidatus Celerinatantimonas neptuna]|nr:MAG: hypothetical protein CENE_00390 [Candidatus Celerinatantimonas neptuna]
MRRFFVIASLALLFSTTFFVLLGQSIGLNHSHVTKSTPPIQLVLSPTTQERPVQVRQRQPILPPPPKPSHNPQLPTPTMGATSPPPIPPHTSHINVQFAPASSLSDIQLSATLGSLNGIQVTPSVDPNPVALFRMPPQYPQRAINRHIEGKITVEFTIMPNGKVKPGSIITIKAAPEHTFDTAVKRAVYNWRFKPRRQNGRTIAFRARQTLTFKLER